MKNAENELLFMELSRSEQSKRGRNAAVLSDYTGNTLKNRLDLYRKTILFHIHGSAQDAAFRCKTHVLDLIAKLDDVTYLEQDLLKHQQNINAKDVMIWRYFTLQSFYDSVP